MKKQNRFRAAALFFALLLISAALLCSCGKTGGDVPGTSDVGTSEAPESGTLDVIKDGKIALVRVVRSADISSSDAPEIVAAKRLRTAVGNFMEELGVNQGYDGTLALEEDILMPGQSYDHSTFEILIGATGYDESSSAFDGLGYGDYTVKLVGNKIVIAAYTSTGYLSAVSKLTTLMRKGMNTDTKSISLEKSEIDFNGTSDEKLAAIPFYSGGKFGSYYKAGNSVDEIIIKKTNTDEYGAYLEALKSAGYTCYTQNEIASNKFATYTNDSYTLSVGFYKYESSVRIVFEPVAEPVPLSAGEYTKVTTSMITQFGLAYRQNIDTLAENGMSYLIRLTDGSFIIIDGGFNRAEDADQLINAMRAQSAAYASKDSDIRVAAWIISHAHGDHSAVVKQYGRFKVLKVERFIVNFMSDEERNKAISQYIAAGSSNWTNGEGGGYSDVLTAAKALGAKVMTAHVGQVFHFADADLEVLYTLESYAPKVPNAFNATSLMIKFTFKSPDAADGKGTTFLCTGDATGEVFRIVNEMYGDYLKSDILQVAHHGTTPFGSESSTSYAYEKIAPKTLLWPIGKRAYQRIAGRDYNKPLMKVDRSEVFIAGWKGSTVSLPIPYTVGSAIVNETSE